MRQWPIRMWDAARCIVTPAIPEFPAGFVSKFETLTVNQA
jgi:hypothetical protein